MVQNLLKRRSDIFTRSRDLNNTFASAAALVGSDSSRNRNVKELIPLQITNACSVAMNFNPGYVHDSSFAGHEST